VWTDVSNAVATIHGTYRNAPLIYSTAGTPPSSPGTTRAVWKGITPTDTETTVVGTSTKLYTLASGTTFTDRSRGGGYSDGSGWSFAQYGIYTLAANKVDEIQVRDATGVAAFANLGGTPPKAKILVIQSNIVLAFNINNGTDQPNAWASSDVGNHANWTTGEAQTATMILHRPGSITAAVAFGDEVIVFKKSSVYRMRYVGSPIYWTVELIAVGRGALTQASVVNCGAALLVADSSNLYLFDGSTFRDIDEEMREYFNFNVGLTPSASHYFQRTENAWFQHSTGIFNLNMKARAWGQFIPTIGGVSKAGVHVLMTGDGIYDETQSLLVAPENADPVYALAWEDDAGITASNNDIDGYVTTGYIGESGKNTYVDRVTPIFKTPADQTLANAPAAAALTMTPYTATTPEITSATAGTNVAASTTDKRFDMSVSAPWQKFKIAVANSPWEIDDVIVRSKPAGAT
jgi:hypothetical protein